MYVILENRCEKRLDHGISSHYLKQILSLSHLSAEELASRYYWTINALEKEACFKYLESISNSCDSETHRYDECNQVCSKWHILKSLMP